MLALRLARPATRTARLFSTTPLRLAQTQEVLPPHDGVAFQAPPPAEDLKGKAVGQVDLPDMAAIEAVSEERAKIPTAPDTYRTQASSPDAEPAPFIEPPAVSTAAHPSTLPGGGPSLQHSGDDSIASGGEGVGGEKGGHGGREERHEFEDRPLNEDERRGLYILGGMLAGGYGLSVATDPRRHRHRKAAH
ncbi:hypothetical protein JCM3775_005690 [Rhodotorula graminis]